MALCLCFRLNDTYYNPNAPDTNFKSIFLNEKVFSEFLKIIGVQI